MEGTMCNSKLYVNTMIILCLLVLNTSLFAAVISVPEQQPTIQAGIDAAKDGDTVLVADGVYKGKGNVNILFKGKQITLKSQNGADVTIIDCQRKDKTRGFIFQNRETNDSVLDGFTIKNGLHLNGGGIFCNKSSPTIKNCIITENRAGDFFDSSGIGGGIYCINSNIYLSSCTIKGNRAGSDIGGGVYLQGDKRTKPFLSIIHNCIISKNNGSGIYNTDYANIWLKKSTISGNTDGSGVVVTANMNEGINRIENCLIELNNGERGAGVSCTENTILNITDSVITTNFGILGGGIFCHRTSTIEVSQCLIVENFASQGAGILVESETGKATIKHCTIANNMSVNKGGGILAFIFPNSDYVFTLTDSIVWGNQSHRSHPEIALFTQRMVIKSCTIRGGLKGLNLPFEPDGEQFIYEDNIDVDPMFVYIYKHDYSLKPNSPSKQMGFQSSVEEVLSVNAVGKQLIMWGELRQ